MQNFEEILKEQLTPYEEGEESKGCRFIRWCFIKGLEKKDQTKFYGKYLRKGSHSVLYQACLLV